MTPEQIEGMKAKVIQRLFIAAQQGEKAKIKAYCNKKFAAAEFMNKPNPNSPTGYSKVRRKTIKKVVEDLGHLRSAAGKSVFDVMVESQHYLLVVAVMQDEGFGLLKTHPFDKNKRYFDVSIEAENFYKLLAALHRELSAQDFQRRAFIRRICYGQQPTPAVDEFLADHYEQIHEELMQFRERNGGRQI